MRSTTGDYRKSGTLKYQRGFLDAAWLLRLEA
jgi:hypothetical protein